MRPKVLEENIDNFNAVTKDAVERMVQVRDSNGEVPNLEEELSIWSTEGKAIESSIFLCINMLAAISQRPDCNLNSLCIEEPYHIRCENKIRQSENDRILKIIYLNSFIFVRNFWIYFVIFSPLGL